MLAAFISWRDRSFPRWQAQLGDGAGDFLQELFLRLDRSTGFVYQSEQATLRYIESAASYCLRDGLRAEARRQIIGAALELGAHGLTRRGDAAVLAERVEMDELMLTAELTRAQRFVIVGLRRGVEREVLCEMLGVTMETVREYERDGITKLREARR